MQLSKHFKKIFKILYILGFIFCFLILFVDEEYSILVIFISSLIFPFVIFTPLFIAMFVFSLGTKRGYKSNLTEIDLKKDKEYYREIINEYSPAELSYIDNLKPLEEKDVCATILSLQLKKAIKIEKNKIIISKNKKSNLNLTEIYILNKIEDGKVKNIDYSIFTETTEREAKEHNLIKKNFQNKLPKDITTLIITYVMIYFINFLIKDFILSTELGDDFNFIVEVISNILSFIIKYGKYFIIAYVIVKFISYSRTKLGENINIKLEGLKLFIKEFGDFDEKESKEVMLWDEYLIYSVIFNIDKKAINEIKKLID